MSNNFCIQMFVIIDVCLNKKEMLHYIGLTRNNTFFSSRGPRDYF